jgi:hypothetical protein
MEVDGPMRRRNRLRGFVGSYRELWWGLGFGMWRAGCYGDLPSVFLMVAGWILWAGSWLFVWWDVASDWSYFSGGVEENRQR